MLYLLCSDLWCDDDLGDSAPVAATAVADIYITMTRAMMVMALAIAGGDG